MSAQRIGTVVVIGALVAFAAAVWGTLATVVTTLNPQGLSLSGPSIADEEIQRFGQGAPEGAGDAEALVGALEEVAAQQAAVRDLVAAPSSPVPEVPRSGPSEAEKASREAIRRGDCEAAADHALDAAVSDPSDAPLVEEAWRCFDAGGVDLGRALAAANGQPGDPGTLALTQQVGPAEARLSAMETVQGAGFGPYLSDLLGAASISARATQALGVEALLGEWAMAGGAGGFTPSFLADRIQALTGGLAGAPGSHLAAHDPAAYASLEGRLDAMMARTGASPELQRAWMAGLMVGTSPPNPPTPSTVPTPDPLLPESDSTAPEATDAASTAGPPAAASAEEEGPGVCDELTFPG